MKKDFEKIRIIIIMQIMNIIFSLNNVLVKCASGSWKEYGLFAWRTVLLITFAVIILAGYAVLWQMILKRVELSVAYLNKGLLVFWGLLWAYFIFSEQITIMNIVGTIIIFIGTLMVNDNE